MLLTENRKLMNNDDMDFTNGPVTTEKDVSKNLLAVLSIHTGISFKYIKGSVLTCRFTNTQRKLYLASGSDDTKIVIWNLAENTYYKISILGKAIY